MIRLLVELYRIALAVIVVCAVVAALPVYAAFGITGVILFGTIVIFSLGISAVLLGIHDHLAAMAPRPELDETESGANARITKLVLGGVAALILCGIVAAALQRPAQAENVAYPDAVDKNGCNPALANSVGLSCR